MPEDGIDWHAWIGRHGPVALLYARQVTGSRADAEDAVHDGFVRFWKQRHNARDLPALFFACVRTAAFDLNRGGARRRRREAEHVPVPPLFAAEAPMDEMRRPVEQALAAIPEAQRETVVLKIWGELTFAQIAQVQGESPNTVATRYRLAMQKLEQILSPEFKHEQ